MCVLLTHKHSGCIKVSIARKSIEKIEHFHKNTFFATLARSVLMIGRYNNWYQSMCNLLGSRLVWSFAWLHQNGTPHAPFVYFGIFEKVLGTPICYWGVHSWNILYQRVALSIGSRLIPNIRPVRSRIVARFNFTHFCHRKKHCIFQKKYKTMRSERILCIFLLSTQNYV